MKNVLDYKVDRIRTAGPRLRCFLTATMLISVLIGSGGAAKGHAATCPALPEMSLSRLQGTVYGPSGIPVPQVVVQVLRDGKQVAQAQTDDKGKFAFKGITSGNVLVHVQFLATKSLDLNVRVSHRVEFFRSARLRIVLGLSGTRCSYASTSAKQFKNEMRRFKTRLEEVQTTP